MQLFLSALVVGLSVALAADPSPPVIPDSYTAVSYC